jgi:predicted TPR repeat methyltransferase
MIEKARALAIYDRLAAGDVETALAAGDSNYDLILAADTIVYLGDLTPLFAGIVTRIRTGGHFLFTAEKHAGENFALGPKRRWRHSESCLRKLAADHNFAVVGFMACAPRTEAGGRRWIRVRCAKDDATAFRSTVL